MTKIGFAKAGVRASMKVKNYIVLLWKVSAENPYFSKAPNSLAAIKPAT